MSMTMEQEVTSLVSFLKGENFMVKQSETPHSSVPYPEDIDKWWSFTKPNGTNKCEVNGGFLRMRDDGMVSYDFFKGGSKYGEHLKSDPDDLYGEGWTTDLSLTEVVQFFKGSD